MLVCDKRGIRELVDVFKTYVEKNKVM